MIKLLELRTERGLTQRQIAKIFNISQGTYNNWENGNTEPSIQQLCAIADFFEISVDYLVGRTDEYKKREPVNVNFADAAKFLKDMPHDKQNLIYQIIEFLREK